MITIHSNKIIRLQKVLNKLGFKAEAKNISLLLKEASEIIDHDALAPGLIMQVLKNIIITLEEIKKDISEYHQYSKADPDLTGLSAEDLDQFFDQLFQKVNRGLFDSLDSLRENVSSIKTFVPSGSSKTKINFKNKVIELLKILEPIFKRLFSLTSGKNYGSHESKKIKLVHLVSSKIDLSKAIDKVNLYLIGNDKDRENSGLETLYEEIEKERVAGPSFVFDPSGDFGSYDFEKTDPVIFLNRSLPQPEKENTERTRPAEEIIEFTEN
jgi:hypothetical protein